MNGLERYADLVEPITDRPYSASGGYGPAGVFTSPLADYYAAFAPSAYVNRSLVDGGQSAAAQQTRPIVGYALATADPTNLSYSRLAPKERVAMTSRDINDYYNVVQELTGQAEPVWPESIIIEPRASQPVSGSTRAAGLHYPAEGRIELYNRTWDAGYVNPDLGYLDYYAAKANEDRVFPHELSHFYDWQYRPVQQQYEQVLASRSQMPRDPAFVTEESPRGDINPAVLLNQMPHVAYNVPVRAVTSPRVLARPAEAGYVPTGAEESELYADQLGTALRLWKNAAIDQYPYMVDPVTAEEIDKYNFVARMSPYIGLSQRLMSGQEITPERVSSAEQASSQAERAFASGSTTGKQRGADRKDEIARALLMEMALSRLSQSPDMVSIMDPVSKQYLPILRNTRGE